jgi:hypothetical protein
MHETEDAWLAVREKIAESAETLSAWTGAAHRFENLAQLHDVGQFAARCIDWGDVLFCVHHTGSGRPLLDVNTIETMIETAKQVRMNVFAAECEERLRAETREEVRQTLDMGDENELWGYYAVAVEAEAWDDVNAPVAVRVARQHRIIGDGQGKALVHAPVWLATLAEGSEVFERCEYIDAVSSNLDTLRGALELWEPGRHNHVLSSYARALRAASAVWRKET